MWYQKYEQMFHFTRLQRYNLYRINLTKIALFKSHLVFDVPQVAAHAETLDLFGRQKISFAEMGKRVWEENKYEVICEPSGLYWYEMSQHWTKTKFIHLTREVNSWVKSLHDFCRPVMDMEKVRVSINIIGYDGSYDMVHIISICMHLTC